MSLDPRPNFIHPTAVLEGPVEVAPGAEVGAFVYLKGHVIIGPNTKIYPHACIGCDPESRRDPGVGRIVIGADCQIREGVVIQRGTGDRQTTVGDRCYLMHGAHVAHDVVLADDVTLSPGVVLGGHTRVHRGATVGIGAMTHQRSTLGAYCMVGMGAVVTRDVPPFALVMGVPARWVRLNKHGIAAAGLTEYEVRAGQLDGYPRLIESHPRVVEYLERLRADSRRDWIEVPT